MGLGKSNTNKLDFDELMLRFVDIEHFHYKK